MNTKFRENTQAQRDAGSIFHLVTELSFAGFQVLKFTGGEQASIRIDKPFPSDGVRLTDHGGKTYGSCVHKGVRLSWEVPAEVPADEVAA
jgi:hypothetical protein